MYRKVNQPHRYIHSQNLKKVMLKTACRVHEYCFIHENGK